MKMSQSIVFLVFAVLATATASKLRSKRGISECTDGIESCTETLKSRMNWNDKVLSKIDQSDNEPSSFDCCYFAAYQNCVDSLKKDGECGAIAGTFASGLAGGVKLLNTKCSSDDYEYPSAKCIFFVWFWYIMGVLIAIVLLSIICCICRCICGRRG